MPRLALSVIANVLATDGTTVRARKLLEILRSKSDVLLITRGSSLDNNSLRSLGLRSKELRLIKPQNTKFWNLKLLPVILENRFDVIYCVADILGFLTYYLFSRILKYKIIFEAHSLFYKERKQVSKLRSMMYFLLEIFVGRRADAIVALSGTTCSFYSALNKNVFFLPVFIDTEFFKKRITQRKEGKKTIGLIGPFDTLANEYQLNFLYSELKDFDKRIQFCIIGRCEKRIADERIRYTGYLESMEEYRSTLCQLDALLVPVRIATYGPKNKILEAMSCRIPVFGTPQALFGLDFAKPNQNVFAYEERELVSKVNEILFLDNCLLAVANAARNTVKRFYDKKSYEKKLVKVIRRILSNA